VGRGRDQRLRGGGPLPIPIAPVINSVLIPPIVLLAIAAGQSPALLRAARGLHRVLRVPASAGFRFRS
jgi:hypothetical protein